MDFFFSKFKIKKTRNYLEDENKENNFIQTERERKDQIINSGIKTALLKLT